MAEIITDYSLLTIIDRLNIKLGFGDASIEEICHRHNLSTDLFLMICRVYAIDGFVPDISNLTNSDIPKLIGYLQRTHKYWIESFFPNLHTNIHTMLESCDERSAKILNKFYDDYDDEVQKHLDYEENTVFPYIASLGSGDKSNKFRIKDFGFCTENRVVRADDYITFGVSEILSTSLEKGKIDAAVIAADGCGTAVITDPYILQGLCGRISGLVETSPLKVVLDAVGRDNVVDPETVPVNMVEGSILADRKGHKRFSVTVCKPEDALRIRELFGDRAIIVGVHTSHITRCGVETMFDCCDFLTACGSRWTREVAKERGVLVAGNKVEI
ncbi:MAG: DUF2099 family protein, partial [Bacteroidales bacterium]|nr:DUF2099 family protein [Bacteroidales bacterium]